MLHSEKFNKPLEVSFIEYCRSCGDKLVQVADFGPVTPICFPKEEDDYPISVPLVLSRCVNCGLVQLDRSVARDGLFKTYWYQSSLNSTMVSSLADVAYHAQKMANLQPGDTVIDIGCNDGTLLGFFKDQNRVGFDPATNIDITFNGQFINDYFNASLYDGPKAKVITAIAMFYDLDRPLDFLRDAASILAEDGLLIIQMTDLASMVRLNAFDNICHEHVTYWSLEAMNSACREVGLHVSDIGYNDVNGGSIRLYIRHGRSMPYKIYRANREEAPYTSPMAISRFFERSKAMARSVSKFILTAKRSEMTIDVLGASTKGNTFLQVARIGKSDIRFAAEVHPKKFGRYFSSTGIPMIDERESLMTPPDYYLVLPWHFEDFFRRKMSWYLHFDNGGFIVPLPEAKLVNKDGVNQFH